MQHYGLKFNKTTLMRMHTTIRTKIHLKHELPLTDALSTEELQHTVEFLQELLCRNRILLVFQEATVDYKKRYAFIRDFFMDLQLPHHPDDMYFCFMYDGKTSRSPSISPKNSPQESCSPS